MHDLALKDLALLFEGEDDNVKALKEILSTELPINLGMTEFQIKHFVMSRREFCTDFMQLQQAKFELFNRIQSMFDLYYQYRKAGAQKRLASATIDDLLAKPKTKIREAKIELQEIEIEKFDFQRIGLRKLAKDKLAEMMAFLDIYKQYKNLEGLPKGERDEIESVGWRIKSAYYPELTERYGLTPEGFLKLQHEDGGLEKLIAARKQLKET